MALLQISEIFTDTRYAKEIRLCGIPIYIARKLDLQTDDKPRQIGFQQIGDTSLLEVDNEDD